MSLAPAQAHFTQGLACHQKGQLDQAQVHYEQALASNPKHIDALHYLGVIAAQLKDNVRAVEFIIRSLALGPNNASAHFNLGNALQVLGRLQEAISSYDHAIALNPADAEAYINKGNVLSTLKRHQEAIESFNAAITLQPLDAMAYSNRGTMLYFLKQYAAAILSYDQAIACNPSDPVAHFDKGAALAHLKQHPAAVASYSQAIVLNPLFALAHCNRGNAFTALKLHPQALASYNQAHKLTPDYKYLIGMRTFTKLCLADWADYGREVSEILHKINNQTNAAPAFLVLALTSNLALQRQAAELCVQDKCPPRSELGPIARRAPGNKIRLGYFSMDFREHPVSALTVGLFEAHSRDHFETVAFSFGPDTHDPLRQRLEAAFDQFIDVQHQTDEEIAALARTLHIDIAIDLAGLTGDARTNIFAFMAAPVQVNYLGYPGTLGVPYFDYIVADAHLIPEASQVHYTEKIVYLPSFQPNDRLRAQPAAPPSRASVGLPAQGFVFCCFNNTYKINPSTFDRWVRILLQVPGSVLWLYEENITASANLRLEAQQRGLDPLRLLFAQRTPQLSDHLARYQAADLFLDTSPYNAHTTASDALWAGLPLLTSPGESFASRVASSVLHAIGLPELIAASPEAYEALAIALATQPGQLQHLKQKLAANRLTTPLFDTVRYTRHVEDAFIQMHTRHLGGLVPEHLTVMDAP